MFSFAAASGTVAAAAAAAAAAPQASQQIIVFAHCHAQLVGLTSLAWIAKASGVDVLCRTQAQAWGVKVSLAGAGGGRLQAKQWPPMERVSSGRPVDCHDKGLDELNASSTRA